MATKEEICTAALLLLGDSPIASFTENTQRARLCANLYPLAKRDVLRAHPWNCAQKRVQLAPLTATPAFDWRYQFALPGDFLRPTQVGQNWTAGEDYLLEGNRILANANPLPLVYVADVSEGVFDSMLTNLMIKRMEMDLAYPVTKSTSLKESLKESFYRRGTGVLAQAKAVDGQENPPADWGDSPFIAVRGGSSW